MIPPARIDHVIYATADLDAAATRFAQELGLASVQGGRHDGMGTHNRIVPLVGGFVELLAVADEGEAARSEVGAALQAALTAGDGWLSWAVAVPDVGEVAAALGISTTSVGRQGMIAQLAGVAEAMAELGLPFFIERRGSRPPGPPRDHLPAIAWIEVSGDPERLARWLALGELPVRVAAGEPSVRGVGIGERELRSR
jgi:hypothetical protein